MASVAAGAGFCGFAAAFFDPLVLEPFFLAPSGGGVAVVAPPSPSSPGGAAPVLAPGLGAPAGGALVSLSAASGVCEPPATGAVDCELPPSAPGGGCRGCTGSGAVGIFR